MKCPKTGKKLSLKECMVCLDKIGCREMEKALNSYDWKVFK